MIAWINVAVSLLGYVLCSVFYIRSVSPAARERKIGSAAYAKCARDRQISFLFMVVVCITYVLYLVYPLPIGWPRTFPWPWWVSAVLSVLVMAPSIYLMYLGVRDAGEETYVPKREHKLYGGIYEKMRHPQAVGEGIATLGLVLLLHSPFLSALSLLWLPLFALYSFAEERDLLVRYGSPYEVYRQRTGMFFPRRSHK